MMHTRTIKLSKKKKIRKFSKNFVMKKNMLLLQVVTFVTKKGV